MLVKVLLKTGEVGYINTQHVISVMPAADPLGMMKDAVLITTIDYHRFYMPGTVDAVAEMLRRY